MRCSIHIAAIFVIFIGCVEPFDSQTETFEAVLVVDARLTDKVKKHEVLLSRARPFEIDSVDAEQNAEVQIVDNAGGSYNFTEVEPGKYVSDVAFGAERNRSYRLLITSSDGKTYESSEEEIPKSGTMGVLSAKKERDDHNAEGIFILLDNSSAANSNYHRYEYEETFKIIAPFYSNNEFEIINDLSIITDTIYSTALGFRVELKLRDENVKICYASQNSTNLILERSEDNIAGGTSRFMIRFLNRSDYIISHRYSILVKQFALDQEAYAYYRDLSEFSSTENVFAQIQPGFLKGNILAKNQISTKVVGYFEVSAVREQRLFFNYSDFFSNEPLPPYAINCEPILAPPIYNEAGHASPTADGGWVVDGVPGNSPLIQGIKAGLYAYYATNEDFLEQIIAQNSSENLAPYFAKSLACGDCTVLGSTEIPDFWIE